MAVDILAEGEYYHIYTRGVRKTDVFHDRRDFARFLFLILHFQGDYNPTNISYAISDFLKTGRFHISDESIDKITKTRYVDLVLFAIMNNHVHLNLFERKEGGISKFMQRVLNAYAKYYNEKYKETGHVFQSKFGRVRVENNTQLLHLSAYIHRNPKDISRWAKSIDKYPWSSLCDYIGESRWPKLLASNHILEQFNDGADYKHFVDTSTAKSLDEDLLIDI